MNRSEIEAAEKAEFIQSVKALAIPSSLFIACVIAAAGSFLVYEHYPVGFMLLAVAGAIIVTAIVAFVRFQNKHRANGLIADENLKRPSAETN